MRWLLVFVWLSSGSPEVTTERFETEAECETAGGVLAEWPHIKGKREWTCYDMKGPAL